MASTWRSYQSFTAWLVAHTSGPASATPTTASNQRPSMDTPEATTPQANAHMGGNQVMGLNNSVTADRAGSCMGKVVPLLSKSVKEK